MIIGWKENDIRLGDFVHVHPGGEKVLRAFANKDATDVFYSMHGPLFRAHRMIDKLEVVGKNERDVSEIQRDFRQLAQDLGHEFVERSDEMTRRWVWEFWWGCMVWFIGAAYLASNPAWVWWSALSLAVAFFQVGWFSHDLAHMSVVGDGTEQRMIGIVGSILGGYSYEWWREKHNQQHHVLTNVVGGDEDIDTLPLIGWDSKIVRGRAGFLVRHQHILMWMWLGFARVFWRWRSLCRLEPKELKNLAIHYAWYMSMVANMNLGLKTSLMWIALVEFVAGWLTSFVFIQSHNGKEVMLSMDDSADFWSHQLSTTSNVTQGWLTNWFSGYLNLQIEHHLFPWLPRKMLVEAQPRVKAICKKHNLPYREYGWWESTRIVFDHLRAVAFFG
jgi:sphingolipid 8-(E/Z)-desaturase